MTSSLLSVLVLTRNEKIHVERCLQHAFRLTDKVFVLDSNSSDGTPDIARAMGATVVSGDFASFSEKLNWGLQNIRFETPWVFRLDADEVLTDRLTSQLEPFIGGLSEDVVGVYVRRQLWFMGRWVRFGGVYPTYSMRAYRPAFVHCEVRDLDEHMILRRGRHTALEADLIDNPLTDLSTWIAKHNTYSTLEAKSELSASNEPDDGVVKPTLLGTLPERVRWLKVKVFYRLPLFVRPCLYFFYRYVVRMGFLDGKTGLIFHVMHGLWYRLLVDAKILELRAQNSDAEARSR